AATLPIRVQLGTSSDIGNGREVQFDFIEIRGPPGFPDVNGCAAAEDEVIGLDIRHELSMPVDADPRIVGDLADLRRIEIPFLEDGLELILPALLAHDEHALLALRKHDLVGRHTELAHGYLIDVKDHPALAACTHLARRTREPGRPHVLDADYGARRDGLQ